MVPIPTPILRFVHVDNLSTLIHRGGLHAPNTTPNDGLPYRAIYGRSEHAARADIQIPCGPLGTLHDYAPFYFGPLSPMMLRLHTGRVDGYTEGQEPLIYCVSSAQSVAAAGVPFVFSDGHGLARVTAWFNDIERLDAVDWNMTDQRYWADNVDDGDRQRRKQAEFLNRDVCPWELIQRVVVMGEALKIRVEALLQDFPTADRKPVHVRPDWYY